MLAWVQNCDETITVDKVSFHTFSITIGSERKLYNLVCIRDRMQRQSAQTSFSSAHFSFVTIATVPKVMDRTSYRKGNHRIWEVSSYLIIVDLFTS